jgi:ribA/ribD-fused uncharacterized protein
MSRKNYIRNWFSNMLEFDCPLRHQGIEYRAPENFYQAMKTAKDDLERRREIAAATPYEAKRIGRRVRLRADWAEIHLAVMETALRHKFAPGTCWHERLMAIGDEEIVEWNNWGDRYWGRDVSDGQGENHLGTLLMKLRDEWRKAG